MQAGDITPSGAESAGAGAVRATTSGGLDLDGVEKTLLIPLWGRAKLTREGNPLLADDLAVDVVDRLGYDFTDIDATYPYVGHVVTVLRARIIDDLIRDHLRRHPAGVVVDLGCGLDTGFWRVDNSTLHWYDVDLPTVTTLRSSLLPETARSQQIAASIFDTDWFDEIDAEGEVLLTSGGVLPYFPPDEVIGLLTRLAARFPGAEMVFNFTSSHPINIDFTRRTFTRMGTTATPPNRLGDIVGELRALHRTLSVVECFPMISRIELPGILDAGTLKQLTTLDRDSGMKIVRLKLSPS